MVANITTAFRKRVEALPWMAAATKLKPRKNSTLFMWAWDIRNTGMSTPLYEVKADDRLAICGGAACLNITVKWGGWASRWTAKNGPCHRRQSMPVNLPLQNALNFPAAILQPPFLIPRPRTR